MKKTLLIASLLIGILTSAQSTDSTSMFIMENVFVMNTMPQIYEFTKKYKDISGFFKPETEETASYIFITNEKNTVQRVFYFVKEEGTQELYCYKSVLFLESKIDLDTMINVYDRYHQKISETKWYQIFKDNTYIHVEANLTKFDNFYEVIFDLRSIDYANN